MCFAWPEHLDYLRFLIPLLFLMGYGAMKKLKGRKAVAYPGLAGGIMPALSIPKFAVRRIMLFAGITLLLAAMAGPELCKGEKPVRRRDVDVVFMLDVSNSMRAQDLLPDRLSQAKFEILQISRHIGEGRKSLMLFAASPLIQCPLTSDQAAFEALLDMASPDLIESQGTVYRRALELALSLIEPDGSMGRNDAFRGEKVLVLVSDGEDHLQDFGSMAGALKKQGVHVYAVGVGTGGDVPIPLASGDSTGTLKRDRNGEVVLTRFRPDVFGSFVREAGGTFYHSRAEQPAHEAVSADIERVAAASRWVMQPADRTPLYHYFMGAGLLLLFIEMQMRDTVRRREPVNKS